MFHVSHILSIFRSLEALVLLLSLSFAALLPILDFQGRLAPRSAASSAPSAPVVPPGPRRCWRRRSDPDKGFALKTVDLFLEQL